MPSSFFSSSSHGIMVSSQRHDRHEHRGREAEDGILRHRRGAHGPHHLVTAAEIGEGLDVGAAHQRLVGRRAAAQPLGIELAHVTLGQGAVFA